MNNKIIFLTGFILLLCLIITACKGLFSPKPTYQIRQIGNDILGSRALSVSLPLDKKNSRKIKDALRIMLECEKMYGGVGISASQCFDIDPPIELVVIGTNDPKTREDAQKRYPGIFIPYETIVVNPTIIRYGKETYFPPFGEGCLSVQGPIRGKVRRYKEVEVKYYDLNGNKVQKWVKDLEAHIYQHEIDHLHGVEFLDKIFQDCSKEQLSIIEDLVNGEIIRRKNDPNYSVKKDIKGELVFERKEEKVVFQKELLKYALVETPIHTLEGIQEVLKNIAVQ